MLCRKLANIIISCFTPLVCHSSLFYWVLLLNDNNTMWWYNNNISRRADTRLNIQHLSYYIFSILQTSTHPASKHTAFSSTHEHYSRAQLSRRAVARASSLKLCKISPFNFQFSSKCMRKTMIALCMKTQCNLAGHVCSVKTLFTRI